jgi:hypothetical protein
MVCVRACPRCSDNCCHEFLASYEQGLKEVREALQAVKARDGTMFPQLRDVERRPENEAEEEDEE